MDAETEAHYKRGTRVGTLTQIGITLEPRVLVVQIAAIDVLVIRIAAGRIAHHLSSTLSELNVDAIARLARTPKVINPCRAEDGSQTCSQV